MADVLIVGGGAIGCAAAFFLARAGAAVTLLERGELAGEATGASAGMLAALSDEGGDRGPTFQSLCLESLQLYEALLPVLEATGIDVRYRRAGVLHVALDGGQAEGLRERFEGQKAAGRDVRWLDASEVARVEPQISPGAVAAMLSPTEPYLDPQGLAQALAAAARQHGAVIETGVAVRRLGVKDGRPRALAVDGRVHEAETMVVAAGPWTAALARPLGVRVPVRPVRGQMLSLRGPAAPLRHVIWGDHAYLVPREEGQTFVGATVEDVGFRKRTTVAALRRLEQAAIGLVPGLAKAPRLGAWAGLRPASADGLPIIGPLPGQANVWVATGHFRNGILLAPITGQLLAESIVAGRPDPVLAPFSPDRFGG